MKSRRLLLLIGTLTPVAVIAILHRIPVSRPADSSQHGKNARATAAASPIAMLVADEEAVIELPAPPPATYADDLPPIISRNVTGKVPHLQIATGRALNPTRFITPNGLRGWKVALGEHHPLATPAIGRDRVFCGGGFGSYAFYALNAETGKLAWKIATTDDGPTAAIVSDGIVVYNTESCTVEALDARDGKRLWSRRLGDPLMSQPAAGSGRVFMVYPGNGGHRLICMKIKNGETIWDSPVSGDAITAPVLHGDSVYLATLDGMLYRFEFATGRQIWKKAGNITSAPWIDSDGIHTSLRDTYVGGKRVPPGSSIDETRSKLRIYPGQDPRLIPIEHSEYFARFDTNGKLVRRDSVMRQARYLSAAENAKRASAQRSKADDASVGFGAAPPTAGIDQAQANLGANSVREVWAYQGSRPTVIDGCNFNAQDELLQCLDMKTGRARWELRLPRDPQSTRTLTPPSVTTSRVYFGTSRGDIGCARRDNGKLLWIFNVGSPILFQPAVMDGKVYFGTENGCVFCIDAADPASTGWPMWGGNAAHNFS